MATHSRGPLHKATTAPSAASQFGKEIEAAVAAGHERDRMTLRLTLGDAHRLRRDPAIPLEDISFAGGVMRFMGVKVVEAHIPASHLDRGES